MFGIKGADVRVAEEVSPERYLEVTIKMMNRFPNLKKVCITLRDSISATHNTWSAVLYNVRTLSTNPTPTLLQSPNASYH